MITFFKTENGKLEKTAELLQGGWVSVVRPTAEEMKYLLEELKVDADFLKSSLDIEESPRIEVEDGQTLIITDLPLEEHREDTVFYTTVPIGIVLDKEHIITIAAEENIVIEDFEKGKIRGVNTGARIRFALSVIMNSTWYYHAYLRNIDKISTGIQKGVHHSMKNKELIQMMELTKSLVYFTTSLKANEIILEKMMRGRAVKLMDEDEDLLDDVLIEIRQAGDMAIIYRDILSGMMDAFGSIISNNLNVVMKFLAAMTIVMTIPTVVSGFYGMNVASIPVANFWFPVGVALGAMVVAMFVLNKFDLL